MPGQAQIPSGELKLSINILPMVENWLVKTAPLQIQARLAHIDSTMETLRTEMESTIGKLREFRQSIVPINRLPPEILGMTMKLVTTAVPYHPMQNAIRLSHICRWWRSVAIGNASLWTNFRIPRNIRASDTEFMGEYLRRSKSLLLFVSDHGGNIELMPIYEALQVHAQRVANLALVMRPGPNSSRQMRALSLPNLRRLEITKCAGGLEPNVLPLFQDLTNLHAMKIAGFSSYPRTYFGNLTTLYLQHQDRSCGAAFLTPGSFLDLFDHTPRLVSLTVFDHGPVYHFEIPTTRRSQLLHLQSVHFIHSNPAILLPCLIFPATTQVIVKGALNFLTFTQRFFGPLPPWMHDTLHLGRLFHFLNGDIQRVENPVGIGSLKVVLLKVGLSKGQGYIHAKKQSGSTSCLYEGFKAFPPMGARHNEATAFVWMLRSLYYHPNLASVRVVEIEDAGQASGLESEVSVEDWKHLLISLPNLEKLRLDCAFPAAVFTALLEPNNNTASGNLVLCPHLRTLRLCSGLILTEEWVSQLRALAERREEMGSRIQKVYLQFSENPPEGYITLLKPMGSSGVDSIRLCHNTIPVISLDSFDGQFSVTIC